MEEKLVNLAQTVKVKTSPDEEKETVFVTSVKKIPDIYFSYRLD